MTGLKKKNEQKEETKPIIKFPRDLTGLRFGRLVVIEKDNNNSTKNSKWICLCDCGKTVSVFRPCLIQNHTRSCGCLNIDMIIESSTTHGMTDTITYSRWTDMHTRCYNEKSTSFKNYGGRGISVCDRWHSFINFFEDMGHPPSGSTLDRIDNNDCYCKENCRWATVLEQANNKRNNIKVDIDGNLLTLGEIAREYGVDYNILYRRLRDGWDIHRSINAPTNSSKKSIYHNGTFKTLQELSIDIGGAPALVHQRISRGWSINDAITIKPGGRR